MHYLIQATLGDLQAASSGWNVDGGDRYIGFFPGGIAYLSGPLIGNPTLPWFEIQCTDDAVLDALGFPYGLMRDELRKPGHLRGAYKASIANPGNSRRIIRNGAGEAVGVTPDFTICGTNHTASFMAGEDPDEAEEITGLE